MSISSDRSEPAFDRASTAEPTAESLARSAASARERALARAFVALTDTQTDTPTDTFDVDAFLGGLVRSCVDLLPVTAAGVLLVDERGEPYVAAATSEVTRQELAAELAAGRGPRLESLRTGAPVVERTAHAVPLRRRDEVIGALGLFGDRPQPPRTEALDLAAALATAAASGILHQRALRSARVLAGQLQTALDTRIVIEQAKGILGERGGLDLDHAFRLLRSYARSRQLRLAVVAGGVVDGTLDTTPILAPAD